MIVLLKDDTLSAVMHMMAMCGNMIAESGISAEHIAYMGDDLTDVVVMKRIGFAVAPANARPEVKRSAHYTTQASGGAGAVRELCELILQAQGYWPELLRKYEVS